MITSRKVVHLLQGLEVGGMEKMLVHLLEGLISERFQFQVICYDRLGPLAERLGLRGIPAVLLPRRPGVDLRYVLRLARRLAVLRPDILHLHNPTALFYGALAGRLARVPRIIYTEHGRDFASSNKNKYLHGLLARLVDRVVAVSKSGREVLAAEGVPVARIFTLHNGVNIARVLKGADRWSLRACLGYGRDQPLLGIVARLDPIKNHAGLLRAMKRVLQAYPEAALLVIGDGDLRAELEQQVQALRLERNVRFLGMRDDVPELLVTLDVAVLNSVSEGLSLTLLEECAAGLAIVATEVGGNPEIILDGQTGLLVPAGDEAALARAIVRLLRDPQYALAIGGAARVRFIEHFSLERMLVRYAALYEGCTSEAGPCHPGRHAQ